MDPGRAAPESGGWSDEPRPLTTVAVPFDRVTPNLGLIVGAALQSTEVDHVALIDYRNPPEAAHAAQVDAMKVWAGRLRVVGIQHLPRGALSDAWNLAAGIAASLGEFAEPMRPWRLLLVGQATIIDSVGVDELLAAVVADADVAFPGAALLNRTAAALAIGAPVGDRRTLCPGDGYTPEECARLFLGTLGPDDTIAGVSTAHVIMG